MASDNNIEVARAFVTIVPSLEGAQKSIGEQMGAAVEPAAESTGTSAGKKLGAALAEGLKTTAAVIAGAMTAATGAAVALGKSFIDGANDVAQFGDNVDKMSQKMGISAQSYQEWDFVMQHCGTSIESLKSSMKTLATSAENGNDAFAKLGITQEQIANMSQEDLFNATIAGLQNVEDTTERTYLAGQLLGRGATELGALLNMSAEETASMKQELADLGGLMSDDAVKDAATYQDSLQNMQTSLTGLKNNMLSQFLPSMSKVMDGLSAVFSGDETGIDTIKEGIEGITGKLADVAPQFLALAEGIVLGLISAFAPHLPQIVSGIFSFINQALVTFTGMIPQLTPVITAGLEGIAQALFVALPSLLSALGGVITELVTWLSTGDTLTQFVDGIIALTNQLTTQFALLLPVLLPAIVRIISAVALELTKPENVELMIDSLLTLVGSLVVSLGECLPEFLSLIGGLLENAGGLLGDFFGLIVPKVAEWIGSIVSGVTEKFNAVKSFITTTTTNIKNTFTSWLTSIKTSFSNAFDNIKSKVSNIMTSIGGFVTNAINKFKELPSKIVSVGKNLISGLWNGISDRAQWVYDKITGLGDTIINKVKGIFGVHSPSRVFAEIGGYLAEGLGIGYEYEMENVQADIMDAASDLTANMSATVTTQSPTAGAELGNVSNVYGGAISINVYGAEGQSEQVLAEKIAEQLDAMTRRKGAVYA